MAQTKKQLNSKRKAEQELENNIALSIQEYIEENKENDSVVETGDLFCEWVLFNIFELREDEVLEATEISGKHDNGIDAVFEYNNELCILQSKYNNSHKIDCIHRFISDCKRIVEELPTTNREKVIEVCHSIRKSYNNNENINCYYITDKGFGEWELEQIKQPLSEVKGTNKNLSFHIYDFENIRENIEIKKGMLPRYFRNKPIDIRISNKNFEDELATTLVAMVKLKDFAKFVNDGGNTLFFSNIRNYLGKNTSINKGIKDTLENNTDKFWFFNNGVTIVCDEFINYRNKVTIKAPQIVNGCQTAKSIWHHYHNTLNKISKEEDGHLLIKVIKTRVDDNQKKILRDSITKYTNSQNAVRGLDFYALDEFQRELKERLKTYGYYYEIQRGAFITESISKQKSYKGNEHYEYLLDGIKSNKKYCLPAKEVIQSFTAAINLRPNVAYGRANELTPHGSEWDKIVNEETRNFPLEYFLFPYLLSKYAKQNLMYKPGVDDFRKNAIFLFLSTYYLFLLGLINKIRNSKFEKPSDIDVNSLISIFKSPNLNKELMDYTHDILCSFFEDSTIEDEIGDNRKGFVQNKMKLGSKFWGILERKINRTVENVERKKLFQDLHNLLT